MKLFVTIALFVVAVSAAPEPRLDDSVRLHPGGRIVGGSTITIADAPYQISLQMYGSHICGGTIISANYIVTAAHCTDGSSATQLTVRAGSSTRGSGGQVVNVRAIRQHPSFSYNTLDYDVSILELATPLTGSNNVKAANLPAASASLATGTDAFVTGWGTTSENGSPANSLQAVTVPTVSAATCRAAYGTGSITARMLCAGVPQGGKDACQGDSGGPLVVSGTLHGITSWGSGCARPNYPGVYSNVPSLRSYITQVTGI